MIIRSVSTTIDFIELKIFVHSGLQTCIVGPPWAGLILWVSNNIPWACIALCVIGLALISLVRY